MKYTKRILLFLAVILGITAFGASVTDSFFKIGKRGSTSDRKIIFDTDQGSSNKQLVQDYSTKNFKFTSEKLSVGDGISGTDKYFEFDIGDGVNNPKIKYNTTDDVFEFANDGSNYTAFGGGSSGSSGVEAAINTVVNSTSLIDGAYLGNLSSTTNVSGGVFLSSEVTDADHWAFVESDSNLVWKVKSVTLNSSVQVTDTGNYYAELSAGDDLYIVKSGTVSGSTNYFATGNVINVSGGVTSTSGVMSFATSSTTGLSAGDFLVKKSSVIAEISTVSAAATTTYQTMRPLGLKKITAISGSAGGLGPIHYWNLGAVTTNNATEADTVSSVNFKVQGASLSSVAGKTTSSAVQMNGSNWMREDGTAGGFPAKVLNGLWRTNFTACVWVYWPGASGATEYVFGGYEGGYGWALGHDPTLAYVINGSGTSSTFALPSSGNQWYFYVVTHSWSGSASTWNVYRNGTQILTNYSSGLNVTDPRSSSNREGFFAIGGGSNTGVAPVQTGTRFDEAYIYNRVLSIGEIQALYNGGTGTTPLSTSITAMEAFETVTPASGQKVEAKATVNKIGSPNITIKKFGFIKK